MKKERTFIVFEAGDYFGCSSNAFVIKNQLDGAAGIVDAIRRSEIITNEEYFDDHIGPDGLDVLDLSPEGQYKAIKKDFVSGDGDQSRFLFEMIPNQTKLKAILGDTSNDG